MEYGEKKRKMDKTRIESAASNAPLTPTQFLNRNPIYKKANGGFIARKFRLEFEKLTSIHPECKRSAQLSQQLFSASKKSTLTNIKGAKRPRKRRMPNSNNSFQPRKLQFHLFLGQVFHHTHKCERNVKNIESVWFD